MLRRRCIRDEYEGQSTHTIPDFVKADIVANGIDEQTPRHLVMHNARLESYEKHKQEGVSGEEREEGPLLSGRSQLTFKRPGARPPFDLLTYIHNTTARLKRREQQARSDFKRPVALSFILHYGAWITPSCSSRA